MARPSTVTVPLLVTASGLKGSNLWPSGFSESLSAFLSGGFEGAGAASRVVEQEKTMQNASRPVPSFNRRIAFLQDSWLSRCRRSLAERVGREPGARDSITR